MLDDDRDKILHAGKTLYFTTDNLEIAINLMKEKLTECKRVIQEAVTYLNKSGKSPRVLVKISRNLGDTLHGQPILRHYRMLYPDACIAYLVQQRYHNAHEYDKNIDKLFLLPNDLDPQLRLRLWDVIKSDKNVDISILPSIHPFGNVHSENTWSHNNIADQFFHNADIKDLKPLGGRRLCMTLDDNDKAVVTRLFSKIDADRSIVIEYHSYSAGMAWGAKDYAKFIELCKHNKFHCISIAGAHEKPLPNTIDMRGITWRQTVAVCDSARHLLGCGSGITMLATCAEHQPHIIELDVPDNVTIAACGYAPAINVRGPNPVDIAARIMRY